MSLQHGTECWTETIQPPTEYITPRAHQPASKGAELLSEEVRGQKLVRNTKQCKQQALELDRQGCKAGSTKNVPIQHCSSPTFWATNFIKAERAGRGQSSYTVQQQKQALYLYGPGIFSLKALRQQGWERPAWDLDICCHSEWKTLIWMGQQLNSVYGSHWPQWGKYPSLPPRPPPPCFS